MKPRTATVAAALLLAGCKAVGPDYHPPRDIANTSPAATGAFDASHDPAFAQAPLPDHWWRLYQDPRLDALVAEALAANDDLRAAEANLRKANALVRETSAQRLVQTQVTAATTLEHNYSLLSIGAPEPGIVTYEALFGATLPIDLFGKVRRAIEASADDREAAFAARDIVRVRVAAAVTRTYADVCAANYQAEITRRVIAIQQETLDATQRLQRGGRGTAFDVSRARTAAEASAARLPAFAAQRQAALYLMATLLGRPPADYPREIASCAVLPRIAQPLPVGDGAALIRRRPDIREAERQIAGDTARIGVATADLYPEIRLAGGIGTAAPLSLAGTDESFSFGFGPLLSWSFPNFVAVKARIAAAGAQTDADVSRFDATVLGALRETETALDGYARRRDSVTALTRARDSAGVSLGQARKLFRFGRGDFLSLLDAQSSFANAEANLATQQAAESDDQVAVFLALGGGWE
jgi:NodT family efflux transporter outer membrane factor (OMF) lipoprotein